MKALAVVGAVILVVVTALVLNFVGVFAFTSADGAVIAATIAADLSKTAQQRVHVSCPPKIAEKRGGIDDCEASAGHGVTIVRLHQDDSRGHFHYTVNDPAVLIAPDSTSTDPSPAAPVGVTTACVSRGGDPNQCGCIEEHIRDFGGAGDLARAADAYRTSGYLPTDLAALADACRRGA